MMKWIVAGLAVIGTGMVAYFSIMFYGPHMNVQQHILGYQQWMPLPPKGMVPVEQNPYAVPPAKEAAGMKNEKLLGNIPQAFSQIGLINAALHIGIARGKRQKGPRPMGNEQRSMQEAEVHASS